MKRRSDGRRRWTACLLLVIFLGYQASLMFFAHTHVVNGERIVHSHPYRAGHDHSADQLLMLAGLCHYVSTEAGISGVNLVQRLLVSSSWMLGESPFVVRPYLEFRALRAPPALVRMSA